MLSMATASTTLLMFCSNASLRQCSALPLLHYYYCNVLPEVSINSFSDCSIASSHMRTSPRRTIARELFKAIFGIYVEAAERLGLSIKDMRMADTL